MGIQNPPTSKNYNITINYYDAKNFIYRNNSIKYLIIDSFTLFNTPYIITCMPNSTIFTNLITLELPFLILP